MFAAPARIVYGASGSAHSSFVRCKGVPAMNSFKFKLEKVLNHKKTIEDERKNQFSCAERQRRDSERALSELKKNEETFVDRMRALQSAEMEVKDMILHYDHLGALGKKISGQTQKVQKLEQQANTCREQLITAKKEKEILEKFKERQQCGYKKESNRQEQKINDEIGIHRYNRRENSLWLRNR